MGRTLYFNERAYDTDFLYVPIHICFSYSLPQSTYFSHSHTVVQFLFQPMEYTVREDEGSPSLTVVQVGDSERPVAFSMAVNVQGTNATSK